MEQRGGLEGGWWVAVRWRLEYFHCHCLLVCLDTVTYLSSVSCRSTSMLSASENDLSVRSHARVCSNPFADECLVCGVDADTVRRSSIFCVLYVGACEFFVRHLKCINLISFSGFRACSAVCFVPKTNFELNLNYLIPSVIRTR
jgi:hypothetical protein